MNDLDLEMTVEDTYRFGDIFNDFVMERVQLPETECWRSHSGRFDYHGLSVEAMGGLYRRMDQRWVPSLSATQTTVILDDVPVTVLELEEEVLAYIRRGKLERAALALPYCNPDRLNTMLHEAVMKGML